MAFFDLASVETGFRRFNRRQDCRCRGRVHWIYAAGSSELVQRSVVQRSVAAAPTAEAIIVIIDTSSEGETQLRNVPEPISEFYRLLTRDTY